MLVDTVMKLYLVISDGNCLSLLPHRARSVLLVKYGFAQGTIHFAIVVRMSFESMLCPGRSSA